MKTKELCIHGLLIALVAVCTMVFQIPVSATQGYVHLGDSMILLVGVFFGARYGMVAGGIGSALADVLSGYSHWAPFTLIIKGLMGWLIGKIASGAGSRAKFYTGRNLLAAFVGVAWMAFPEKYPGVLRCNFRGFAGSRSGECEAVPGEYHSL